MDHLSFKNIEETGICHAVYTPIGIGNWKTETDKDALKNYIELGKDFDINPDEMVRTNQVHSAGVRIVTKENGGEGITRPYTAWGIDGLITNVPGLMLCTIEADCTPVYLLDPVHKVIAMLHSGWKGTAGRITTHAIDLMRSVFNTAPEDIIAAIGPCICKDCYEVSDDLIPPFSASFSNDEVNTFFTPKPNGKYWLDLKTAIFTTLTLSGVKEENIEDSGFCTFHDNKFYSWRRDRDASVRMLTAICLKKQAYYGI